MQGLVKYAHTDNAVEIRDVPEPTITPDQVLLEVKAVGVCGSDIHMWHENQSWAIKMPVVMGHEFAGVVAQVGDRVTNWKVGDRVACETAAHVQTWKITTSGLQLNVVERKIANFADAQITTQH